MSVLFSWRQAVVESTTLTATQKLVALVLSLHMNGDGGSCYPSLPKLASETGCARSTVAAALAELRGQGFVAWPRNDGGRDKSNHYTATLPNTVRHSDGIGIGNSPTHDVNRPAESLNRPAVGPEDV